MCAQERDEICSLYLARYRLALVKVGQQDSDSNAVHLAKAAQIVKISTD